MFSNKTSPCNAIFEIKNYKEIKNIKFEFPIDSSWVFILGDIGSGKTSVLKSIARALSAKHDIDYYDVQSRISLDDSKKIKTKFSTNDKSNLTPSIIGYGSQWVDSSSESSTFKHKSSSSLFTTGTYLRNIENEILNRWCFNPNYKKGYKNCVSFLKKLVPNLTNISTSNDYTVYYEFNFSNKKVTKEYHQLSTSYQHLIKKFGDMYIYLYEYKKDNNDNVIVLIDGVDLYLSNEMQFNLPKVLSASFPNVIFIATTNSPNPMQNLPKNNHCFYVENNMERGININKIKLTEAIKYNS